MQTTHKSPAQPFAAATAAQCATGPVLISPELLQFIGGGKSVSPTPRTPTAPKNTW